MGFSLKISSLFFITCTLFSENINFVSNPNGIKIYEDKSFKKSSFIPYKDSFEKIGKELEVGRNPFFAQEIKYKNKTYFIKTSADKNNKIMPYQKVVISNQEAASNENSIISFGKGYKAEKSYFYSRNKIKIYKKPFLDSIDKEFLNSWTIYESDLYSYSWYRIILNHEYYYVQNENLQSDSRKQDLEKLLNFKFFSYKNFVADSKESLQGYELKNDKLEKFKILNKQVFLLKGEIEFGNKKYYLINSKEILNDIYIEKEKVKKFSFNEFTYYTLKSSKWKNDLFVKNVLTKRIVDPYFSVIDEFIDFRTIKKTMIPLGKTYKLIFLNYFGKWDYSKENEINQRVYFLKNDKIVFSQIVHENIKVHDFDGDKIPEIILENEEARWGTNIKIIKVTKDEKLFYKSFENQKFHIKKNLILFDENQGLFLDKKILKFQNGKTYLSSAKIDNGKFILAKWYQLKKRH